jgi:CRP/FNR family cyclic AMP-dependent transcriptional regulator
MTNISGSSAILKAVPLFSALSDEQLASLFPAAERRTYPRGAFILRRGEEPNALYIILAGRAKVLIESIEGRELTIMTLGRNEFSGEMSLIDDKPQPASVEAVENCEVLYLSRKAFMAWLHGNSDATILILKAVIRRLQEANRKIAMLAFMDVYGRVEHHLTEAAKEQGGAWIVGTALKDIARIVGASHKQVSRVLRTMSDRGLIRRDKQKIVILNRT